MEGTLLQNPIFIEAFEKLEKLGDIRIPLGQDARVFSVYLGRNLTIWKPVRTR